MKLIRWWSANVAETLAWWALHVSHRDHRLLVAESLAIRVRFAEAVPYDLDDLPVEPLSDAEFGAFMRAMGRDPETGGRL